MNSPGPRALLTPGTLRGFRSRQGENTTDCFCSCPRLELCTRETEKAAGKVRDAARKSGAADATAVTAEGERQITSGPDRVGCLAAR